MRLAPLTSNWHVHDHLLDTGPRVYMTRIDWWGLDCVDRMLVSISSQTISVRFGSDCFLRTSRKFKVANKQFA